MAFIRTMRRIALPIVSSTLSAALPVAVSIILFATQKVAPAISNHMGHSPRPSLSPSQRHATPSGPRKDLPEANDRIKKSDSNSHRAFRI